ncbi:hypothetical protein NE237_019904 [Protea cynaroides]|uniref:Uncharacterized protein n=1 Tax=Protea cynaroides TaxID=273540 RepID=A0A9Q0HA52_9MAGN|nr:hypothetical protein NE237_019904 [Protea cynaroides]
MVDAFHVCFYNSRLVTNSRLSCLKLVLGGLVNYLFYATPPSQWAHHSLTVQRITFVESVYGEASGYDSVCFDGVPVSLNNSATVHPPSGLCLEKISNVTYIDMVGHTDGSNRVFITDRQGRIWLATVLGSGGTLGPDKLSLFLDILDEVYVNYDLGLMATIVNQVEVRRIFSMELPFPSEHGVRFSLDL